MPIIEQKFGADTANGRSDTYLKEAIITCKDING